MSRKSATATARGKGPRRPRAARNLGREVPPRLLFAHLDPDDGRLVCAFAGTEAPRIVRVELGQLGLPAKPRVVCSSVDEFGAGIDLVRKDGTRTDCGADLVLYITDRAQAAPLEAVEEDDIGRALPRG